MLKSERNRSRSSSGAPERESELLLALEPVGNAASVAREALRDRGMHPDLHHTVTLLTSEVVGNAVRHGGLAPGEKVVLHARIRSGRVRIEVADRGPGFDPEVRHEAAGFGLRLIDRLASRWGVKCGARSCRVWFEVGLGDVRASRLP